MLDSIRQPKTNSQARSSLACACVRRGRCAEGGAPKCNCIDLVTGVGAVAVGLGCRGPKLGSAVDDGN